MTTPLKLVLLLCCCAVVRADAIYRVTDLGGLPGGSVFGFRLNASGDAVGWQAAAGASDQAWRYAGDTRSVLAAGTQSQAYGLNSGGIAVGSSDGQAGQWQAGQFHAYGSGATTALAINDAGQVVGSATTTGGEVRAYVWSAGELRDLGLLASSPFSVAYDINQNGTVVGVVQTSPGVSRAFRWSEISGFSVLGTLGGRNSYAMANNDTGATVGQAQMRSGALHAFLSDGSKMRDLGTLGGTQSYAYGVNNQGAVVGYSDLASGDKTAAFLYKQGQLTNLNSLLSPDSGWQLTAAYDINDQGQIVGTGWWNGSQHAYRLDLMQAPVYGFAAALAVPAPVPEPATNWLVGAALLGLRWGLRQGRR